MNSLQFLLNTRPGPGKVREKGYIMVEYIIENGLYEVAVQLMDDEIREELHSKMAGCTEKEFLTAYMEEHYKKYGVDFVV